MSKWHKWHGGSQTDRCGTLSAAVSAYAVMQSQQRGQSAIGTRPVRKVTTAAQETRQRECARGTRTTVCRERGRALQCVRYRHRRLALALCPLVAALAESPRTGVNPRRPPTAPVKSQPSCACVLQSVHWGGRNLARHSTAQTALREAE